jgi:hypothetical protein
MPTTSFCRKCGAAITGPIIQSSEQPTAILGETDSATTQRLQPRATSPAISALSSSSTQRNIMIAGALGLLILGIITAVAIVRVRNHIGVPTISELTYPDAQPVVDMTNTDGSRTLQLQTPDSLDKVESWYQNSLKLTKTMRLTSTSYVMKNDKVTITLATENNKTNILIKQLP